MTITADEIVELYHQRRQERGWQMARMLEMQRQVDGDIMVPLPEMDQADKPSVANLVVIGLDAFAQRVGSVMPDIYYPPTRPGIGTSEERARQRREANLGWWDMNQMQIKVRHRARYLLAYGSSPVTIGPTANRISDKRRMPHWRVRDPLATFPAHMDQSDGDYTPEDYIVSHKYSLQWLSERYPDEAKLLYKGKDATTARDTMFEVLEYNDADCSILVAVGAERPDGDRGQDPGMGYAAHVQLGDKFVNRAGICNMVCPGRIVLHKLVGQFDSMLHLFRSQAKMAAFEEIALSRSIFAEEWVTSHPNAPSKPKIVRYADAKQGIVGQIENGTIISITPQPGAQVPTGMDRIERSMRLSGSIPAEMGGESGSNIRTARRGEMVLSAGVDQPLQEAQEILAASFFHENIRAVATEKGWFGSRPTSFYIPENGVVPPGERFVPNEIFETDYHVVRYSFPGSDSASIPIEIGQRVGTKEMSLQTAREMDPAIDDPILERDRVEIEGLDAALLSGLEQAALQPGYDPTVIAKLAQWKAANHGFLHDGYLIVHEALQKEQAAAAAAQQPQGQPALPGAPGQPALGPGAPPGGPPPSGMPGAGPGAGPPPAIGAPDPSQVNLSAIMNTLRRPANQGPAERGVGIQQTADANA